MFEDKCFKPLFGFCTCLYADLRKGDVVMALPPMESAKLCAMLGSDFYTYLILYDNGCHEIVKVCQKDGVLYVDRPYDATAEQEWSPGTDIKFDWALSAVKDLTELASKEGEDDECPKELFTGEIKNGNCTVSFKDGLAVSEKATKRPVVDACYENPVITVEDGCIVAMAEGSPTIRRATTCDQGCCG